MFQLKRLLPLVLSGMFLSAVYADSQRTNFSVENQFPRWEQIEAGLDYTGYESDDDSLLPDKSVTSLYLRYGLLDNLSIQLDVPFVGLDLPNGNDESGLGDLKVAFQLRTFEDIFGYPYFIPHVSFTLPTGDDEKGLGVDGTEVQFGISYGSTINDSIDWVLDLSYRINPDEDNQFIVGHSYVWDISDAFALVTELLYEEAIDETEDGQLLVAGGFSYDWTESIQLDASVGGGVSGPINAYGKAGLSYSF